MVGVSRQPSPQNTNPEQEPAVDMSQSDDINRALDQAPAARADKVAQAKALLADGTYPSDADLGKVADLLARNLDQAES